MDRTASTSQQASSPTPTTAYRPLRPYYVAPSPEEFLLGATSTSSSSSSPSASASASALSSGYSSVSSILLEEARLATEQPFTWYNAAKNIASTGLLNYSSIAFVMPFEVGKTLMQVQWIPRSDVELLNEDTDDEGEELLGGDHYQGGIRDIDQLSDEDDVQAYFHDLHANTQRAWSGKDDQEDASASSRRKRQGQQSSDRLRPPLGAPSLSITRERDSAGYLLRRSIFDKDLKPDWILPFTVTGGVWDMIKSIARWKGEGWAGLWKGQMVTFIIEALSTSIQPALYTFLASILLRHTAFSDLPLIHVPSPLKPFLVTLASHVLTAYFLSPLDLIRTRFIVQSSQPKYRKYTGVVQAFNTITEEEGGGSVWRTFYYNRLLAFPTIVESSIRSIFNLGIPLFIERKLLLSSHTSNVVLYGLTEFCLSSLGLLFTLPFETVKHRLHLQSLSQPQLTNIHSVKAYRPCVELRPTTYTGVTECMYRILTEETGRLYLHNADQKVRRPSLSSSRRGTGFTGQGPSSRRHSNRRPSDAGPSSDTLRPAPPAYGTDEQQASGSFRPDMNKHPMPMFAGVTQLYRGLSMGITANLIVFVLGLVAGRDDVNGWTEV